MTEMNGKGFMMRNAWGLSQGMKPCIYRNTAVVYLHNFKGGEFSMF